MKDYEIIGNKLKCLATEIFSYYKILINMFINGQNNSPEFFAILESIKKIKIQEDEIYENLKENPLVFKVNTFLFNGDYLDDGLSYMPEELELIKSNNEENIINARMSRKICEIIYTAPYPDEDEELYDEELEDDEEEYKVDEKLDDENVENYKELDIEEDFIDIEEIFAQIFEENSKNNEQPKIYLAIENDIAKTIFKILNIYIENEEYADIRENLLRIKTYFAYIYPDIESLLLENNFVSYDYLFWTSYMEGNRLSFSSTAVKELIKEYLFDIISKQIETYYDAKEETEYDIKKLKIALAEIILRACMTFFNEEEIENLKKQANIDIEELSAETDINNSLNTVFRSIENDSTYPLVLALDPSFRKK